MPTRVDFAAPDLAARIEQLSQFDLDRLPFGVILIDRAGHVLFYSQTEAEQSGYGTPPLGQNLFSIGCMGSPRVRARIERAMAGEGGDATFDLPGDYGDPGRVVQVRVQPARQGGAWICIARAQAAARAAS
jgi:hypothetical protein